MDLSAKRLLELLRLLRSASFSTRFFSFGFNTYQDVIRCFSVRVDNQGGDLGNSHAGWESALLEIDDDTKPLDNVYRVNG